MVYYIYVLVPRSIGVCLKLHKKIKLKKKNILKCNILKKYLTYNFVLRSSTQDQ